MRRWAAFVVAAVTLPLPASGGNADAPEVRDRAGDANYVSDVVVPAVIPPTAPAQAGWADITAVWTSTDYYLVDAVRDGVRGKQKVPYGLATSVATSEAPNASGAGTAYEVTWAWNNCHFSTVVQLPGALPDSPRALFYEDCAAAERVYELDPPEVNGRVVTAHVPFAIDLTFFSLFPGASLAEIEAATGHYVDGGWPSFYRPFLRRSGVIDYAPSDGKLGYFEVGSDLEPSFIPDEGGRQ